MQLLKNKQVEFNNKVKIGNIVCIVFAVLTVFFTIIAFIFFFKTTPEKEYKGALKFIDQGKIGDAVEILYSLDGYKDSRQLYEKICHENSSLFLYLLKTGDTFDLGTYQGEKVNWTVIDEEDGMLLVESTYVVDAMKYSAEYDIQGSGMFATHTPVLDWNKSIVYNWSNNTFFDSFSESEKRAICSTEYGSVFILSAKEEDKYEEHRPANPTKYASTKINPEDDGNVCYWLRYDDKDNSKKTGGLNIIGFSYTGMYDEKTYAWDNKNRYIKSNEISGVRPCMWIKPCEIID